MSILLDALKKSEEQRQLGKVPGIHSPVEGPPPDGAGRRRWILWLLVFGSVLIVTWTAWRQFGPTDPQPVSAPESVQRAATPSGVAGEADATDPPPPSEIEAHSGAIAPGRSPVEELPSSDEAVGPETPARPATVLQQGEGQKSQVNKSFTAYETPPPGVAEERVAEQHKVPAPATANDIKADPSKKSVTDKQKPSGLRVTEPISFWELPQSVRDGLPDLRITVLVFAERPEDRFLLVGGQRMVEKDEYQPGVVLDEIRRDGAVFLYRNYRFLVKG
jgi:general secretion pathway protein B